jgi:hypothetical protein
MCMSFSPSQALTMRSSGHERGGDGDGESGGRLCLCCVCLVTRTG